MFRPVFFNTHSTDADALTLVSVYYFLLLLRLPFEVSFPSALCTYIFSCTNPKCRLPLYTIGSTLDATLLLVSLYTYLGYNDSSILLCVCR